MPKEKPSTHNVMVVFQLIFITSYIIILFKEASFINLSASYFVFSCNCKLNTKLFTRDLYQCNLIQSLKQKYNQIMDLRRDIHNKDCEI